MSEANQEQEQQNTNGNDAAGGNAASNQQAPAKVFGTATRTALANTQQGTQEQQQATTQEAQRGRGPVSAAAIPADALKVRLDRAKQQGQEVLFRELGVKTEAEAKAKLAELKNAGAEAEKRRLAEMSEIERLKAENATQAQRIAQLEAMLVERDQERDHEQHEQMIGRVAGESITPKAMRVFKFDLAQHVKKLAGSNPDLAAKFGERGVRRFLEKWVKENPEFAVQAQTTTTQGSAKPTTTNTQAKPPQTAPTRRPVTTGVPVRKPGAAPVTQANGSLIGGKTMKPGQANSMSSQEVKAAAAKLGITYNPM